MVDIPDDIDLVDYDNEDPEEDPEEEPEEDGDKTPPLGDVSSDSMSSDSESDDEEIDVAPEVNVAAEVDVALEVTVGTSTQKPYAICDFPRGLYEVGESSSARDSSYVGRLAPWTLRRDLETSRARARLTEAELKNFERALGNVLERVSVLKSGENATLKKRLAETETKLAWACMERDIAERRLHESRVWNKMFYLDMVRIRAVPKPPSDDEDTERPRKKSKNSPPSGTESLLSHMDHLARKYIEKGCQLFLAQVTEQESKEKRLEDVLVIRDFPEVFPKELPRLSPPSTIRNEGVVQATARVVGERFYSTELVAVGSSDIIREEEG
ncbi:hypothetical protein Tco_0377366 [Tanacetum coccineum]